MACAIRILLLCASLAGRSAHAELLPLSPTALTLVTERNLLYVACATANQVIVFDLAAGATAQHINVPASPLGLALLKERLYVTCAAPASSVAVIDITAGQIVSSIPIGHTAMAPVLHPNGKILYVCNRFNDSISIIDLLTFKELKRVPVPREPVAAAITPDGKHLLVANHLHHGAANATRVASSVTVIGTDCENVVREIPLPNGSGLLRGICISPDGKHAAVTHLLSRFQVPTTQIDRGWINNNALTLLDTERLEVINTVLLDDIGRGAANPWACAWSADGKLIVVTHAGTHELSLIDAPGLLARLADMPATVERIRMTDDTRASRVAADVPNDLSFIVGLRRRVALPETDRGPRAVCLADSRAYVANYFSDSLTVMDADSIKSIKLGGCETPSLARKGELYFNDATICFQGWQSCASCHSSDARVDGLNWDNLNDGIGNPKNVKSLLQTYQTPPSMWLGVRSDAAVAVRAGIKSSLFTVQPPEVAEALDAHLKSLSAIPSPHLRYGKLSPAARRGQRLFGGAAGCADCHPKPLYTDLKAHNVGTSSQYDKSTDRFDTPSLCETWRTAPYLHDGSAATILDVLTTRNLEHRHGSVEKLTHEQLSDLIEFVSSL